MLVGDELAPILATDPISHWLHLKIPWPAFLAGIAGLGAIAWGLSHVLHIATICDGRGYAERWNWYLMYTLVIPVLSGLARYGNEQVAKAIVRLRLQRLIRPLSTETDADSLDPPELGARRAFVRDFAAAMGRHRVLLTWLPFGAAILFNVFDAKEIWMGALSDNPAAYGYGQQADWSVAFADWTCGDGALQRGVRPTARANWGFDGLAWGMQFLVVLQGVHYATRFVTYLNVLMSIDDAQDEGLGAYTYEIWYEHPTEGPMPRGLNPLANSFNAYLGVLASFGLYLVGHRYQDLSTAAGNPVDALNLRELHVATWATGTQHIDIGIAMTLVLWLATVTVVAYYPMVRWRRFLVSQIESQQDAIVRMELRIAKLEFAEQRLKKGHELKRRTSKQEHGLRSQIRGLQEEQERLHRERRDEQTKLNLVRSCSVWPNGDVAATFFLMAVGTCTGAFFTPETAVLGGAAGFLAVQWRKTAGRLLRSAVDGTDLGNDPNQGKDR